MDNQLPNDIWKDPMVQEALKDGRPASDIYCLRCPTCNRLGYYNEGSHFTCRFCDRSWMVMSEGGAMSAEEAVSLADTVTETTEGYDNQTQ